MCLYVKSERLVATEDIVCYKILFSNITKKEVLEKYSDGDPFFGIVEREYVKGIIHIFEKNISFEITTNNESFQNSIIYSLNRVAFLDRIKNFYTPYFCMSVEIGKLYNGMLEVPNCCSEINIGFHSYIKEPIPIISPVICECIIPKESTYYIGAENDMASNRIKYVKIVTKWKK